VKPSEVAQLLAFCAAFDRRTVGEADAMAWHTVLGHIPYEQAREAVTAHYSNTREWIMPADILQRVRKARAAVLDDFQYEPGHPDEPPAVYLARRRQQLDAVARGERPAALPALGTRNLPELTVGQTIPEEPEPEAVTLVRSALDVRCPYCHAPAKRPCKSPAGRRLGQLHPSRLDASKAA
jgi:hypothetical protein